MGVRSRGNPAGASGAATGERWALAAPHHRASEAGAEAFRAGGNAVDAALAAAVMLTVVYPNQCSVGGDVIALVGRPDGRIHSVNGSGRAPIATDVDAIRAGHRAMPVSGPFTVTVPGAVAAWHTLADGWGRQGMAPRYQTAETVARDGFPIAPGVLRDLHADAGRLRGDPGMAATFLIAGRPLTSGARLRLPRLADTLAELRTKGAAAMYGGDVGTSIARCLGELGSAMTVDDLLEHRTGLGQPMAARFGDDEYLSTAENSQGQYFLAGLREIELLRQERGRPIDPLGADAALVARILRTAAERRDHELGEATTHASGDTVAVVAADADGTWVSLIQSNFHAFGSGIMDPATGVVLHNRGASFSLEPGRASTLTPGRRPPHTLMPVLVRRDGKLIGAHGTMGGRAQPQIHTQLALHLANGHTPAEAVGAPRWVLANGDTEHDPIRAENDVPFAARNALAASGFSITDLPILDDGAGHAQLVRLAASGLSCASDPRADGAGLAG